MERADAITKSEGETLLKLARDSVQAAVSKFDVVLPDEAFLQAHRGVFVTHKSQGRLRGCIGYPTTSKPLAETVLKAATSAALHDNRFNAVTEEELPQLEVEVSVLTPPVAVKDVTEIVIGQHGLIVSQDSNRGLLLPQVAPEQGWTREQLLQQTCIKAGLPPTAWQTGAQLEIFEAQIFQEHAAPKG